VLGRRRRVRDWPLLLLRCLAVALLALAFARPFATGAAPAPAAPGGGGREVVILVDRSYSMGAPGRWARATAAARRAVDGLGRGDQATLVLFDQTAAVARAATGDRAELLRALDTARVGAGVTRYTPALALAAQILGASTRPAREAVLVTDFQRAGWQPDAEARLPAGARLVAADVGAAPANGAPANVAVADVELRRGAPAAGREQVTPVARLTSTGAAGPRDVAVTLEVNGRAAERRTVRVPPNGAAAAAFGPVALPGGPVRGVVRVADPAAGADALAADDALHFAASPAQVVRVLVVEGAGARANASLYLRRALAVGDRPPFRVETRRAAGLGAADLAGRDVVILHDAPPAAGAGRALVDYVRRGGGLVVALGQASGPAAWPAEAAPLLPATPGAVVDRGDDGGARLVAADRAHPVFEAFAAPRSGDLSAARVLRYRALGAAGGAPLARFDDGAPALVEHALGAGRVLVWASTFDGFWNDLALQPVFVPLVHRLAAHAARHADAPAWRLVGETLDPARLTAGGAGAPAGARWAVATPAGRTVRLGGAGDRPALALAEAGFYEVRRPDAPAERPAVVAANVDRAESELARVEPAEVVRAVEAAGGPAQAAAAPAAPTPAEREAGQRAWWYLLAAALALLAGEAVLANRRGRAVRAPL
jgi:hypothetical protein